MRVFVALDIPAGVREALADVCSRLKPLCRQARWVRLEGVHVTLKFIGEAEPDLLDKIRGALGQVTGSAPIGMRFAGVGFFPGPKRPRVFWAGIDADPGLAQLAGAIEAKLEPLGIAPENREFRPHLTLARFEMDRTSQADVERLRAAAEELADAEFGCATANEFYLYQSVLKRGGAEYVRLATYSFAA